MQIVSRWADSSKFFDRTGPARRPCEPAMRRNLQPKQRREAISAI